MMNGDLQPIDSFLLAIDCKTDETIFLSSDIFRLAIYYRKKGFFFDGKVFLKTVMSFLNQGTLVVPAYTDYLKDGDTFDRIISKPNTGALSKEAFTMNCFIRTNDPFHSFFVWGKEANKFKNLKNNSTFGSNSGFALIHQLNARAIFIDIPLQECFTFAHYCEEQQKVAYRIFKTHRIQIAENGKEIETVSHRFFTRKCGYVNRLNPLESKLEENSILKSYIYNGVTVKSMHLQPAYDFILNDIINNNASSIHHFYYKEWLRCVGRKLLK